MKLKRLVCFSLSILLGLSMIACGEYKPANSTSSGQSSSGSTGGGSSDEELQNPSTVSLYYYVEGRRVPYTNTNGIDAIWTGEGSVKTASFDEYGVATVEGLDGDYQVTLSGIPEGYTYNPNVHVTTNNARDIEVELYEVIIPEGEGTHMYNDYVRLSDETKNAVNPYVYRITVDDAEDRVHCQFSPPSSGMYSVESWVDVTAQDINPKIDVYNGSFAFKVFSHLLEDGGVSKGYTSNFKHEVRITDDMIGNDFSFAVYAGVKNDRYPVTIDFVVQCDGEWIVESNPAKMMTHGTLVAQKNYDASQYEYVQASVDVQTGENTFFLDGEKFKFNEQTGYYHFYDETLYQGYTETYTDGTSKTFANGFGPILYMEINAGRGADLDPFLSPYQGTPIGFSNVEMPGNKNLTLSSNTENYKMFIEGYAALVEAGHVWLDGLTEAEKTDYAKYTGYSNSTNSDGVYGVTEELKEFAQKYSVSQELFADGEGRAEDAGYDALDDDQWLFACVYYRKIN